MFGVLDDKKGWPSLSATGGHWTWQSWTPWGGVEGEKVVWWLSDAFVHLLDVCVCVCVLPISRLNSLGEQNDSIKSWGMIAYFTTTTTFFPFFFQSLFVCSLICSSPSWFITFLLVVQMRCGNFSAAKQLQSAVNERYKGAWWRKSWRGRKENVGAISGLWWNKLLWITLFIFTKMIFLNF